MLKLQAEKREIFGKRLKPARAAGHLPVVVYGGKRQSASLFVKLNEFKKVLAAAGESDLVTLEADGKTDEVLIHEVAIHPTSGEPLHADFYAVAKGQVLRVDVPLEFVGAAPAVREQGGILVKVLHGLKVEGLPGQIPHKLTVDISRLMNLDSQILVRDLKVPAAIKILQSPEAVVAAVTVVEEEPIVEAPVDLSAIEVEKKGKKEEAPLEGEASLENDPKK